MTTRPSRRYGACALGAWLLALPAWTFGQSDTGTSPAECMQVALAEPAAAPEPRPASPPDPGLAALARNSACWIEIDAVAAWAKGDATWIDVRPVTHTRAARLGGALEIALADVSRKTFLQSLPVVLVGTGYDDVELAKACRSLHDSGFAQVRLLRGGVRAWQQAGRPLTSPVAVDSISAAEFHKSVAYAPWLVLGVGLARDETLSTGLADLRRIDAADAVAAIARARDEQSRLPPGTRATLIVVVGPDAASARQLREDGRRARLADVVYLEGGLAGYRQFLLEQQSIAANAGKPLTRPCGSS